jgi:hypothetical protein
MDPGATARDDGQPSAKWDACAPAKLTEKD